MSIPQQGGGPIESRDQLAAYIASGEKPRDNWRIGTEHEKFGFTTADLLPLPYEGPCSIKAMLTGLRERFGWAPVLEQGNIIGLERNGANVSLEPGGQLELPELTGQAWIQMIDGALEQPWLLERGDGLGWRPQPAGAAAQPPLRGGTTGADLLLFELH